MKLPRLPKPVATGVQHQRCHIGSVYTAEQMKAYAAKAVEAKREVCVQVCEEQRRTIECLMVGIDDTTTPVIARIGKLVVALETADYALSAWQRGADVDDYYRECDEVASALQTARQSL